MEVAESIVCGQDGIELFVRKYASLSQPARRVLMIVHGAGEHGGRYEHVAKAAVERGWTVIAPDLRGHGRSSGTSVHVDRFDDYLDDLRAICNATVSSQTTLALLAHSMGGLVAIRAVETHKVPAVALVTTAPLLGVSVPISPLTLFVGRILSTIAPRTRFRTKITPEGLTHDAECLARRAADPLMHGGVTARWFFEVQAAIAAASTTASQLVVPLLAFQGDIDPIVDPQALARWFEKVGSTDKTLTILPDHLHEILNEPDYPTTINIILNWLEQRVPEGVSA